MPHLLGQIECKLYWIRMGFILVENRLINQSFVDYKFENWFLILNQKDAEYFPC